MGVTSRDVGVTASNVLFSAVIFEVVVFLMVALFDFSFVNAFVFSVRVFWVITSVFFIKPSCWLMVCHSCSNPNCALNSQEPVPTNASAVNTAMTMK